MPFSIATWNINSVRLRMPIVERLLIEHAPDVLCLQETKCPGRSVSRRRRFASSATSTSRSAARRAITASRRFPAVRSRSSRSAASALMEDCRHLSVRIAAGGKSLLLHNFYVPAGGDEPDPEINRKFRHKLDFVAEMNAIRAEHDERFGSILVGDLNIAPLEHDVWSHKQLLKVVSHTPVETERFEAMRKAGDWIDLMRLNVPLDQKLLHLVELSRPGLGAVRSRPAARPRLVFAESGREPLRHRDPARCARLGAARPTMCRSSPGSISIESSAQTAAPVSRCGGSSPADRRRCAGAARSPTSGYSSRMRRKIFRLSRRTSESVSAAALVRRVVSAISASSPSIAPGPTVPTRTRSPSRSR